MLASLTRHPVSRQLVLGWCVWLIASLVINRDLYSAAWSIAPEGAGLVPAARGMVLSMAVGVLWVWPVWRLSQRRSTTRQVASEWLLLVTTTCAVIWMQHVLLDSMQGAFFTRIAWPWWQTALMCVVVCVWSAGVVPLILWGSATANPRRRIGATVACLATTSATWAAGLIGGPPGAAVWSPWHALWVLCDPQTTETPAALSGRLGAVAVVAAVAGAILIRRTARL